MAHDEFCSFSSLLFSLLPSEGWPIHQTDLRTGWREISLCVCESVLVCVSLYRPLLTNPLPRHEPFDPLPLVWAVCRVFACVYVRGGLITAVLCYRRPLKWNCSDFYRQQSEGVGWGENKNKSTMRTAGWYLEGAQYLMDSWAVQGRGCDWIWMTRERANHVLYCKSADIHRQKASTHFLVIV